MAGPEKGGGNGLPYGVVMATAGASHLAHACGAPALADVLLWLAIGQAIWILLLGLRLHLHDLMHSPTGWMVGIPPERLTGNLTIPLGLAVIESGLATRFDAHGIPALLVVVGLILTWLATCICVGRFVVVLGLAPPRLRALDGTWFLAPAVLLGVAIATIDALPIIWPGVRLLLAGLAEATIIAGLVGYWITLVFICRRVARHGLSAPRAPWWIAMGCAGLAVAAMASVQQRADLPWADMPWTEVLHIPFDVAMWSTFTMALALLVPTVALSLDFLCRHCRFAGRAVWPPTFSTAVFAMGCLGMGTLLQIDPVTVLGQVAGWATLALWTTSGVWNIGLKIRHAKCVIGAR